MRSYLLLLVVYRTRGATSRSLFVSLRHPRRVSRCSRTNDRHRSLGRTHDDAMGRTSQHHRHSLGWASRHRERERASGRALGALQPVGSELNASTVHFLARSDLFLPLLSQRLPYTIAKNVSDYPAAIHFGPTEPPAHPQVGQFEPRSRLLFCSHHPPPFSLVQITPRSSTSVSPPPAFLSRLLP